VFDFDRIGFESFFQGCFSESENGKAVQKKTKR